MRAPPLYTIFNCRFVNRAGRGQERVVGMVDRTIISSVQVDEVFKGIDLSMFISISSTKLFICPGNRNEYQFETVRLGTV